MHDASKEPSRRKSVRLCVNGVPRQLEVNASDTLAEVLREKFGLWSVKVSCNRGECGTCTVITDGDPVLSCTMLAADVDGKKIETVEGIQQEEGLHPLQRAFIEYDALQCGFCTPGMILSLKALFDSNPTPSEAEIKQAIAGNICRCGTYPRVVKAALFVSEKAIVE